MRAENTPTRRDLLRAGAAVAGSLLLARPVRGATPRKPLRNGEILPSPDFSQLRTTEPYLVGVRPHRKTGVRLELEAAPLEGPAGRKRLVHNYGHGGAGITLSWGCAAAVVREITPLMAQTAAGGLPSVAVVGTGVIGLTTATEVKRRWPGTKLTVYARDLRVQSTVSFIAGGQFEPSGIWHAHQRGAARLALAGYLRASRDRLVELQNSGKRHLYGVAERRNYTLDHPVPSLDDHTPRDVVPRPERGLLPFEKLRAPGREYRNWLMNPTVLLPRLVTELTDAGAAFLERTFTTKADLLAVPEDIIIHCTGLGARTLMADADVVPQRGHLVVLRKTDERQFWLFSGGCGNPEIAYVFCRQDDIVVGGSVVSGDDRVALSEGDDAECGRILSNARTLFEGTPDRCIPSPARR